MDITLKNNLRELRKKKNVTQESLAEHIGISPQAVGKWERGEGFPDITILPAIAFYFGVSVDNLLGVGELAVTQILDEYDKKNTELCNKGYNSARVALWNKAMKEYPSNLRVIYRLMCALFMDGAKKNADEIIELGERILLESSDTSMRDVAIQCLCNTYRDKGNIEKAKELAQMMAFYYTTCNELMRNLLEGEKAVEYCQDNISILIDLIHFNVMSMVNRGALGPKDSIRAYNFAIKAYELLYEDGDFGFYECRMSEMYQLSARLYAEAGQYGEAITCLEQMATHTVKCDTQKKEFQHTSFMANRLRYSPENIFKDHTCNECSIRLSDIKDKAYDGIREDERFREVVNTLQEYAQ